MTSVGIEGDNLTLAQSTKLGEFLGAPRIVDIAPATMVQRIDKSAEEIALIREGARVADHGGYAIHAAIREGVSENRDRTSRARRHGDRDCPCLPGFGAA